MRSEREMQLAKMRAERQAVRRAEQAKRRRMTRPAALALVILPILLVSGFILGGVLMGTEDEGRYQEVRIGNTVCIEDRGRLLEDTCHAPNMESR